MYSVVIAFITIITFNSISYATCSGKRDQSIQVYGELHDSIRADKLWELLLEKLIDQDLNLYLEAVQFSANDSPDLKKELLGFIMNPVDEVRAGKIFGIDSEELKTIDIFGAAYLVRKGSNHLGTHLSRVLYRGVFFEPEIRDQLLAKPFEDPNLNELRMMILKESHWAEVAYHMDMAEKEVVLKFYLKLNTRAIEWAERSVGDRHNIPIIDYVGDPEGYLLAGMKYRDEHMSRSIQKLSCATDVKNVAVIVGKNHLAGIRKVLTQLMPNASIDFIDIEK